MLCYVVVTKTNKDGHVQARCSVLSSSTLYIMNMYKLGVQSGPVVHSISWTYTSLAFSLVQLYTLYHGHVQARRSVLSSSTLYIMDMYKLGVQSGPVVHPISWTCTSLAFSLIQLYTLYHGHVQARRSVLSSSTLYIMDMYKLGVQSGPVVHPISWTCTSLAFSLVQ